ncbi:unnamed protein product [Adineta ricciae]|uniref:Vesicle-fusing ATPase n=1 Tax=Adineta ricciae TaxID=249248 RepID=A0A815AX29_ADIRI|nr:unnamed protein product [Adineta ricciae]CAF1670555.1 unnamed protein product [Adineta ricciae]
MLLHIEGMKDIPNLIMLGATNRRNIMDVAFLHRIQGKCFVGRPSPKIREKMLLPLLLQDSRVFSSQHIDFLVRGTTNFSGAAVASLRSDTVVTTKQTGGIAREYSCRFSAEIFSSIFRHFITANSIDNLKEYSLQLDRHVPSGRVLVDLTDRKCIIELANDSVSPDLPL